MSMDIFATIKRWNYAIYKFGYKFLRYYAESFLAFWEGFGNWIIEDEERLKWIFISVVFGIIIANIYLALK